MSDQRLRELEKRYRSTGSLDDEVAWLKELVRVGKVTESNVEFAAMLGQPAAQRLSSIDQLEEVSSLDERAKYQPVLYVRLGVCAIRSVYEQKLQNPNYDLQRHLIEITEALVLSESYENIEIIGEQELGFKYTIPAASLDQCSTIKEKCSLFLKNLADRQPLNDPAPGSHLFSGTRLLTSYIYTSEGNSQASLFKRLQEREKDRVSMNSFKEVSEWLLGYNDAVLDRYQKRLKR